MKIEITTEKHATTEPDEYYWSSHAEIKHEVTILNINMSPYDSEKLALQALKQELEIYSRSLLNAITQVDELIDQVPNNTKKL